MDLIGLVTEAIAYANSGATKLNDKALSMEGMSSSKVRNFLNSLLAHPGASYLEIGVWRGSTFYSALYGNNPKYALAIDNFSQFDGDAAVFTNNMADVGTAFEFLNCDAFNLPARIDKNFNIYFYDGEHSFNSQRQALTYYHDFLAEEFIYVCDDWNFKEAKDGTLAAIREKNLQIVYYWELPANYNGDLENWWNGLWVAVLKKQNTQPQ